jgi:hypothetical protein
MGGLIAREAIGGSGGHVGGFPDQGLLVPQAVTVATPHAGVDPLLYAGSLLNLSHSAEIGDMTPSTDFMSNLGKPAFNPPQGSGGTHWGLIGASVPNGPPTVTTFNQASPPCSSTLQVDQSWTLGRAMSCLAEYYDNARFPWGDGVVQAVSMMGMKADEKILYGTVEDLSTDTVYASDPQGLTQYQHETETCFAIFLGPTETCTNGTFYLNDGSTDDDAIAFECTSNCTATDLSDMSLTRPATDVPHSLEAIETMLVPPVAPPQFVTGHAAHAGDDYPWETLGQFGRESTSQMDPWHEFYGQCDSFAAWKVYENLAGQVGALQKPLLVPAPGFMPNDWQASPVDQYRFAPPGHTYGNADIWATRFSQLGVPVDNVPAPGAIAWWPNAVPDPQDGLPGSAGGLGPFGHVGYVTDVYDDGSINLESYNMRGNGEYEVVHMKFGEGYTDNGFGGADINVPWPGGFIHVAGGAGTGFQPTEPSDPGVVFDTYPGTPGHANPANYNDNSNPQPGLTVIGPEDGNNNGDFTFAGAPYQNTVDGWSYDPGHGEIGQMFWTSTHKGAADSTATWSPKTLTANACYQVDAFVPDDKSNNDAALYTVYDQQFGTSMVPVNENNTTNDWVELGVFRAKGTALTVTLTDQGSGNGLVAADALRYMQQATCNHVVQASLTKPMTAPATSGGWTYDAGLGQLGNSDYYIKTSTSGTASAQWAAIMVPSACYEIFAYVPDNNADSYQAQYWVASGSGAIPTATVDESFYANQFVSLGTYQADQNGYLLVNLSNRDSSSSNYVSADTMSFVQTPCPPKVLGAAYPALTLGPASPLPGFSLYADWFNDYGHGYLGYGKWTSTNGTTAESTATWTFRSLPANKCYKASAYIPDNNANNTKAHYQGYMGAGTSVFMFSALINQATTSGWIPLGVVSSGSSGAATITLDDTGPTGTYTAADAVQLAAISC